MSTLKAPLILDEPAQQLLRAFKHGQCLSVGLWFPGPEMIRVLDECAQHIAATEIVCG